MLFFGLFICFVEAHLRLFPSSLNRTLIEEMEDALLLVFRFACSIAIFVVSLFSSILDNAGGL